MSFFADLLFSGRGLPHYSMREISSDDDQRKADDIVTTLATLNFTMLDHTTSGKPITIICDAGTTTFIGTTSRSSITTGQSVSFYPRSSGWFELW